MREPGPFGTSVAAELIGSQSRPPSYAEGRVCAMAGCGTRLSIYNAERYCSLHGNVARAIAAAPRRRAVGLTVRPAPASPRRATPGTTRSPTRARARAGARAGGRAGARATAA